MHKTSTIADVVRVAKRYGLKVSTDPAQHSDHVGHRPHTRCICELRDQPRRHAYWCPAGAE